MELGRRCIIAALVAAFVAICTPGNALASDNAAVVAKVHQFMDGFNKGDTKSALAACASQTLIVDEFSPHQWTSCAAWASAIDAYSKANGDTDQIVTLGTPWQVSVTGNVAYAVFPANYNYKEKGKPVAEHGSVFTVVLKKGAGGWQIVSWTWSQHP